MSLPAVTRAYVVQYASLGEAEESIQGYVESYQMAGQALTDVFENDLWREGKYASFDDYCEQRWQFTRSRASQLISAGRVVRQIATTTALPAPQSERHVRPLLRIKDNDPDKAADQRAEAWAEVVKVAEARKAPITAELVEGVVDGFVGAKEKPAAPFSLEDLTLAFAQIADSPVGPVEAVKRWGDPGKWKGFAEALRWMETAREVVSATHQEGLVGR